jgi:predicted GNAT family acetyltransferase
MEEREPRIVDNPEARRFELWLGEEMAGVMIYRSRPNALALIHTEVDPAFSGQGLGGKFVVAVLDELRERGVKILPLCPFVSAYLERHPEYLDLVAPSPAQTA